MKSAKTFAASVLLFSSLFFTACTQDREDFPDTEDIITRTEWSLNEADTGLSRGPLTDNYTVRFLSDGTLEMHHSNGTYTGSWKLVKNVQAEVLQVTVASSQPDATGLNNTWTIQSLNTQAITLQQADNKILMQRR